MTVTNRKSPRLYLDELPIVPPPSTVMVASERIVLYNASGEPLVRKIGF